MEPVVIISVCKHYPSVCINNLLKLIIFFLKIISQLIKISGVNAKMTFWALQFINGHFLGAQNLWKRKSLNFIGKVVFPFLLIINKLISINMI